MKKLCIVFILLLLLSLVLISCTKGEQIINNGDSSSDIVETNVAIKEYNVIWKNYDGSIIKTESVSDNKEPSLAYSKKMKSGHENLDFTFNKWDKYKLNESEDIVFVATGTITIPNNITAISEYLFEDCIGISEVIISNNILTIEGYAFKNCEIFVKTIGIEDFKTFYYDKDDLTDI